VIDLPRIFPLLLTAACNFEPYFAVTMQRWTLLFLYFSTPVLVFGFDLGRMAKNRNKSAPNGKLPLLIKNVLSIPPHVR